MLLDQLNSSEPLKKTKFSLCFPRVGHKFYLSTLKPQESEVRYNSMYVTVVWQMGKHPELLLGEPCAVTAGSSRSPGSTFLASADRISELRFLGGRERVRPLTLRSALGPICTFSGALIP